MVEAQQDDRLSFEDMSLVLREVAETLDASRRRLTGLSPGSRLQNLQKAIYGIDAPVVHRLRPLERHMLEWSKFVSNDEKTLGRPAMKYLCWVPEVATDERFLAYAAKSDEVWSWSCLGGLVRSCHLRWESLPSESPSVLIIRGLLKRYKGPDRILTKWRTNLDAVLGKTGPLILAEKLIHQAESLRSFLDEWRLEACSPFSRKVVETAAAGCRARFNLLTRDLLILLFRDLLPWPGWELSSLKKEVGALILHRPMNGRIQEILQRFVLHFDELGDPRLAGNRIKWVEVPEQARDLFTRWLLRENAFILPEHVYQQGKGWFWYQKPSGLRPLSFEQEEWQQAG